MKKIFLLLTVLSSPALMLAVADSTIDAMIMFKQGEKKHKSEWFNLEKAFKDAKLDLLKRQHMEKYELEEKGLQELKREGFSEQLLQKKLAAKVALCEKHLEEWNMLCKKHHEIAQTQYMEAKQKLDAFKQAHLSYSGYSSRSFETAGKSEKPNFLERALDLFKDSFPKSGY